MAGEMRMGRFVFDGIGLGGGDLLEERCDSGDYVMFSILAAPPRKSLN
jgi:hypothetical protein